MLLETVRSERQDALAAARKAEQDAYGLSKLRAADAVRLQEVTEQLAAAVAARDELQVSLTCMLPHLRSLMTLVLSLRVMIYKRLSASRDNALRTQNFH